MIARTFATRVTAALAQFPAVAVVGSRQSGKTTLAKQLCAQAAGETVYLDLELPSDLAKLKEPETYLEEHVDALIVLDEIHRRPELFPVLRGLIDRHRRPGRFLILGSASLDLLRQGSESLAGRITFIELPPFILTEVAPAATDLATAQQRLWLRGGYPESYLAPSLGASREWREAFITTFLERDVPQLGIRVSATRIRRFWEMLAHLHGQVWNSSALARNFDVSPPTVSHYLDLLTDTFVVRQLQPLYVNLKKRLVKSPKVYLRDSGLLHTLLRIPDLERLRGHPVLGASYEGFVMEQVLRVVEPGTDATFYRTHTGDEIDLVLTLPSGARLAVEVKHTAAPRLAPGYTRAMADIGADRGYIVTAGRDAFPLGPNVRAVPLYPFLTDVLPGEMEVGRVQP
jgi:predicted AAA+ superfamily ATPase